MPGTHEFSDDEAFLQRFYFHTPDEVVTDELERAADRAQRRRGVAAPAAFLERATELTPDPAGRAARALAAAQAKFAAAAPDAAHELLAAAEIGPLDELQRGRLALMRARIVFTRRRGSHAAPLLLDAAKQLEPLDNGLACETYLEALGAAIFAGRLSGPRGVQEAAEAARAAPPAMQPPRPTDLLLGGVATRFTEGYVAGVPPLRRALHAFRREAGHSEADIMRARRTASRRRTRRSSTTTCSPSSRARRTRLPDAGRSPQRGVRRVGSGDKAGATDNRPT